MSWEAELRSHVAQKGMRQVAHELGISKPTVSLVCRGKYGASTDRIRDRVAKVYGNGGLTICPVLGEITPGKCAETHRRAKTIGLKAGNPQTVALFKACLNCPVRADRKGAK